MTSAEQNTESPSVFRSIDMKEKSRKAMEIGSIGQQV
jgi:hypothetical protein